ncbi:ATP-dependent nuclease [Falsiporphyromonas endometrii]|uniref:ATP-dependent endonuclease n=1 Tax=Falsiporphyromonas endometrii TaxID=1387297 RepID=A0ABV9K6E7_9PORP
MKISRIKVENFRSIKKVDIQVSDFNIFVGQNNCGKTNLFEAIEFFFNGYKGDTKEIKYQRDNNLEASVYMEFSDVQNGLKNMKNEKNRATLAAKIENIEVVGLKRSTSELKKRSLFINGESIPPGTGFDTALNDFLPKFEYITTKQYYDAVAKYSKTTPMGVMLTNVLVSIIESNQKYLDFQKKFFELFEADDSEIKAVFDNIGGSVKMYLEKQFPDTTKVRFEVTPPIFEDLLKSFSTAVDDGIETSAEEKGDGMQRALMLSIIQTYADYRKKNDDQGKSFLFFIDEAELHLHPMAQRKLKDVLYNLSEKMDQVFINTHSSVFITETFEKQCLFKVEKTNGETGIHIVEENDKPYIVYELLGGSPADLLLPNNFLIVEGKSEFELISRVINRFYKEKPKIHIIQAHGDIDQTERTINAIEKAYLPLENNIYADKLVILLDAPSDQTKGGVEEFKKQRKKLVQNNQIFTLAFRDIEQCYPNQEDIVYGNWKKTQAEVDEMSGKKKVQLAKYVGNNITQEQFEKDLKVCFDALNKCWELAFQ